MGYRSEVICAFVFKDELVRDAFHTTAMTRFCASVPDWDILDQEWFMNAFSDIGLHSNYVVLMKFEDIKWYPDTEIPKFVTNEMMPECVKRGGAYSLVRIGEETGDIEEDADHHDNFDEFHAEDYVRVNSYIEVG
jgi:hypothetical protein